MSLDFRVSALSSEDDQELDAHLIYGLELLPIDHNQQTGDFIVLAVHMLIEALRMEEPLPAGVNIEDFCTQMGVVYGEQICMEYGWEWKQVKVTNGYEGVAVVAPDMYTLIFPIPSIYRWIKSDSVNRCITLFKELETLESAGQLRVLH